MMKILFVWFRRSDVTHDQALAEWSGARHTSAVKKISGLKKWIQNIPAELPNATAADGVGELWFDTAETMQQGMAPAEMAPAVVSAWSGFRFAAFYSGDTDRLRWMTHNGSQWFSETPVG